MKKTILKHIKDLIIVTIIGFSVALIFMDYKNVSFNVILLNALFSFVLGGTLWKGNQFIGWLFTKYLPYEKNPKKVFLLRILSVIIFSAIAIFAVYHLWFMVYYGYSFNTFFFKWQGYWAYLTAFIISISISLSIYAKAFFKSWREEIIKNEKLQKEAMELKYEALKSQVNPHFLFNSLNVLSSLVYKNQDTAVTFIKELANVYRYVLDAKNRSIVSFQEELGFTKAFLYLQQMRFNEQIKLSISGDEYNSLVIIPLSLQVLIENAIKHNIIDKEYQLIIDISINSKQQIIEVRNNIQLKNSNTVTSSKIGLNNIAEQYHLLCNKTVSWENNGAHFIVKLPILKMEDIPSIKTGKTKENKDHSVILGNVNN